MFPMLHELEARTIRAVRAAIVAMLILLAAGLTIVSQQTTASANIDHFIRICLPVVDNGDLVHDYGYFTFTIEADGQSAATLGASAEEGEFPCHDILVADYNINPNANIVVKLAQYSAGWRNAANYPQYSIGQGLVAGDSVAFPLNGGSRVVYFYLMHAYNADLQICNGIEDNGDGNVDSGTWTYSLAVQGQQPFHTESVSTVEGQEENCLLVLLRDYGIATPVSIVVTELANPGIVDQAGYPRWQNFAADQSGTGSSMTLSYAANTNQRHGYFFHKRVAATPAPPPPLAEDPMPWDPGQPIPTPMPTPAPVDEPVHDETPGEDEGDNAEPNEGEPATDAPADDAGDEPATGPGDGAPADGTPPAPAPGSGEGGALPIEEDEDGESSPVPGHPVATPSAPNTGNAGLAAERQSFLPWAMVLAVAGLSGAGAAATARMRQPR